MKNHLFIILIFPVIVAIKTASAKTQYVVNGPIVFADTRANFHEGNFFAIQTFEDTTLRAYLVKDGKTHEYIGESLSSMVKQPNVVLGYGPNDKPAIHTQYDKKDYCAEDGGGNQFNVDVVGWASHYRSNGAWLRYADKIVDPHGNNWYLGIFHAETNACYPFQANDPALRHFRPSVGLAFRAPSSSVFSAEENTLFPMNYNPYVDEGVDGLEPPLNSDGEPHKDTLNNGLGLAQASATRTDSFYYLFTAVNNRDLSVSRIPLSSVTQGHNIPVVSLWALRNPGYSWEKHCHDATSDTWFGLEEINSICDEGEYYGIPEKLQTKDSNLKTRLGRSPAYDLTETPFPKLILIGEDSFFGLTLTTSSEKGDLDSDDYNPSKDLTVIPDPLIPYHGRHGRNSDNLYNADHYGNASIVAENGGNRITTDSFFIFYRYATAGSSISDSSNLYRKVEKVTVPKHMPKVKIALNRYQSPDGADNWDTTKDPYDGEQYTYKRTIAYLWTKKVPEAKMRLLCDATHSQDDDKWVRYRDYEASDNLNSSNFGAYDGSDAYSYYTYCQNSGEGERILGWIVHPSQRRPENEEGFFYPPFEQLGPTDVWKLGRCKYRNGKADRWVRYYNASTSDDDIKDDKVNQCSVLGYALK